MITEQVLPSLDEVVVRLQVFLERHPINGAVLETVQRGARRDENWYYVPVILNAEEPRTYEYYDLLIEIEEEFRQQEHLNVLLIPSG